MQLLQSKVNTKTAVDSTRCIVTLGSSEQPVSQIGKIHMEAANQQASSKSIVGSQSPRKNLGSHIDASHSRQPLVKGERLVRYEVNAVMPIAGNPGRKSWPEIAT